MSGNYTRLDYPKSTSFGFLIYDFFWNYRSLARHVNLDNSNSNVSHKSTVIDNQCKSINIITSGNNIRRNMYWCIRTHEISQLILRSGAFSGTSAIFVLILTVTSGCIALLVMEEFKYQTRGSRLRSE